MKSLTCRDMGGACDEVISGATFEEIGQNCRAHVMEALKRGDLTARKSGRRTLIAFADLEAYLANLPTYRPEA